MRARTLIALNIGKIILKVTKKLHIGGGSAAPGHYALKIDPQFLKSFREIADKTILITGTNGKTTTSRLIYHTAKQNGLSVLVNSTGSNLARGVASTIIQHSDNGKEKFDLAIWELDEAAFNSIAYDLKPNIIIFLNAFRDQLDRYGEVDTVIKKWVDTLSTLTEPTIVLNNDMDSFQELTRHSKNKLLTFGLAEKQIRGEKVINKRLALKSDYVAKNIQENDLIDISFDIATSNHTSRFTLPIPGIYNIYNFLAAYIALQKIDISDQQIKKSLPSFAPAFGRVERFRLNKTLNANQSGFMFLIKNPTGANQVFQTIKSSITTDDRILIALNDNLADGTDVSWIWDARFEELSETDYSCLVVTGNRAYDLAVRLKYAGVPEAKMLIEPNINKAFISSMSGLKGGLFILPTYTAMLEIQGILRSQGLKGHYWEEE